MVALFMCRTLDAKPDEVLPFAARFFTDAGLRVATAKHGEERRAVRKK